MSTSMVENVDETMATWQAAIYQECLKIAAECGAAESSIDGAGADGDELAFTLSEIGQAFNLLRDARDSYKESAESWSTRAAQEQLRAEQAEAQRDACHSARQMELRQSNAQLDAARAQYAALEKVWEHEHYCSQCRGHYYCAEQDALVRDWQLLEAKSKDALLGETGPHGEAEAKQRGNNE